MNKKLPILAILAAFMFSGCTTGGFGPVLSSEQSVVNSSIVSSEIISSKAESSAESISSVTQSSVESISSVAESSQKESSAESSKEIPSSSATSSKESSASSSETPSGYTAISTVLEEVGTKEKAECTKSYKIRGTIDEITKAEYKDFYINDSTGRILIYGLDSATGSSYTPTVGDEVAVEGIAFYFNDSKNPENSGVEIKNAVLLDYPGKPSSSSSSQTSTSSSSSSASEQSSSVAPSGDVLVGSVKADDFLSKSGYQTVTKTVSVGKTQTTFEINDVAYSTEYAEKVFQFAKCGHEKHTSTIVIKNAKVHQVKLTVYGYKLSQDENGVSLSANGVTFNKVAGSVSASTKDSVYTLTFTASAYTSPVDITISNNNSSNARYISTIEFIA